MVLLRYSDFCYLIIDYSNALAMGGARSATPTLRKFTRFVADYQRYFILMSSN